MLKQNYSSRSCQKTFFMSVVFNFFGIKLSLWFCITKEVMKQTRWFNSTLWSWGLDHPLATLFNLYALFWPTDDSVLFCSSFSLALQTNIWEELRLLGYYSVILVHWFDSDLVRWMPDHKGMTDVHSQKNNQTFESNILFLLTYRHSPVSYERLEMFLAFVQ